MIQTLLFVAGINTLLQALFGTRLPAIVGGSFAYVIPILYIINDSSLQRIPEPHYVTSVPLLLSKRFFISIFGIHVEANGSNSCLPHRLTGAPKWFKILKLLC